MTEQSNQELTVDHLCGTYDKALGGEMPVCLAYDAEGNVVGLAVPECELPWSWSWWSDREHIKWRDRTVFRSSRSELREFARFILDELARSTTQTA